MASSFAASTTAEEQDSSSTEGAKELFDAFMESPQGRSYERTISSWELPSREKRYRLLIDLSDVQRFNSGLQNRLRRAPMGLIGPWRDALEERVTKSPLQKENVSLDGGGRSVRVQLGLVTSLAEDWLTPRDLRSQQLGSLVCVQGVVTQCCASQPRVVKSVHWCEETKEHVTREYRDSTDLVALDDRNLLAKRRTTHLAMRRETDANGNVLEPEYGLAVFKDHQKMILQEPPELTPHGQLPRSVQVVLENDLVDTVKPGDFVQCAGVYRVHVPSDSNGASSLAQAVVVASSIAKKSRNVGGHDDSLVDDSRTEQIEKRHLNATSCLPIEFLDTMTSRFAPSICGRDLVKKALILQLVGGSERHLASGARLRGDINVLVVGDPSTAKSQLLRASMRAAPVAVSTTGRGSSGVGLTAALAYDNATGERRLEAGAVVLADRGLVCIDEFDKMSTSDRVAIHEVMEQQTVTLSKAGIHASLNARCAVLAAANPVYGIYDINSRPQDNIGMPDSLLSRFDLLFLILDTVEARADNKIADHVLRSHCHTRGTFGSSSARQQHDDDDAKHFDDDEAGIAGIVDSKQAEMMSKARDQMNETGEIKTDLADPAFIRKFVRFTRHNADPVLDDETRESIAVAYADLRIKADDRSLPITARCLESLIRLSTAHAKIRLSPLVQKCDCSAALDVVSCALYGDVRGDDPNNNNNKTARDDDEDDEASLSSSSPQQRRVGDSVGESLRKLVENCTAEARSQGNETIHLDEIMEATSTTEENFADLETVLNAMEADNRLMYDPDTKSIHLC